MASPISSIVDDVVALLLSTTFSLPFSPIPQYVPEFPLEEITDLTVRVAPSAHEVTLKVGMKIQHDVAVDVLVEKRLDSPPEKDKLEMDAMLGLVDEIHSALMVRLPSVACAPVKAEHQLPDRDRYRENRTFRDVTTFIYRHWK